MCKRLFLWLAVAMATIVIVWTVHAYWNWSQHTIRLTVAIDSATPDQFVMTLTPYGVQSVSTLLVKSADQDEPLWAVGYYFGNFRAVRPFDIRYGATPVEGKSQQVFPKSGQPRVIVVGERIIVSIWYRYGDMFVPSMGQKEFLIERGANGSLTVTDYRNRYFGETPKVDAVNRELGGPRVVE